jgi:hypothetical protein
LFACLPLRKPYTLPGTALEVEPLVVGATLSMAVAPWFVRAFAMDTRPGRRPHVLPASVVARQSRVGALAAAGVGLAFSTVFQATQGRTVHQWRKEHIHNGRRQEAKQKELEAQMQQQRNIKQGALQQPQQAPATQQPPKPMQ